MMVGEKGNAIAVVALVYGVVGIVSPEDVQGKRIKGDTERGPEWEVLDMRR